MASSPFINPNEPLISIFDSRNLVPRFVEQAVPLLSPQYQRPVLSKIIDQLDGAVMRKATNRQFSINRMPNDFPYGTIASRTASGAFLTLTFNETSFEAIPVGNAVMAASGCLAEVVVKAPGTVTLRFVAISTGATAFAATDFAVGEYCSDRGALGDINNRHEPETIFTLPNEYLNYIGQMDAAAYISKEDVNNKTYIPASGGGYYYAMQKESQALQRLMQMYYARLLSNIPAVKDANKPVGASLLNQIITMGGLSVGVTGNITESVLKSAIRQYVVNGGFTGEEIVVTCGSQYLGDVQESLASYLVTAGKNNVVGGAEVEGINIYEYGFEGLKLKFIKDPFLDNKNIFGVDSNTGYSKRSKSAIWMSTDPCKTENNQPCPFVADYYFGNTSDVQRWVTYGSMDEKGNNVEVGSNGKKGATVNFTLDKQTQLMNPAGCMYHGN